MSIPGISSILRSQLLICEVFWIILNLASTAFGFYNIYESAKDYYSYDVITNVERVTPENVTFPGITICLAKGDYKRFHYNTNGTLISKENQTVNTELSMQNFIQAVFLFNDYRSSRSSSINTSQLEFFEIPQRQRQCLRFNGAANQQLDMIKVNSTADSILIRIENSFRQIISDDEFYCIYAFNFEYFEDFISDNFLNSEQKLPKPFNICKQSPKDQPYHQLNCIGSCIYR